MVRRMCGGFDARWFGNVVRGAFALLFGGAALAQGWTAYSPTADAIAVAHAGCAQEIARRRFPIGPGQTVP